MSRCAIVGENALLALAKRYCGVGPELSHDEKEILMFALFTESEQSGGVASQAKRELDALARKQRIVKGFPA